MSDVNSSRGYSTASLLGQNAASAAGQPLWHYPVIPERSIWEFIFPLMMVNCSGPEGAKQPQTSSNESFKPLVIILGYLFTSLNTVYCYFQYLNSEIKLQLFPSLCKSTILDISDWKLSKISSLRHGSPFISGCFSWTTKCWVFFFLVKATLTHTSNLISRIRLQVCELPTFSFCWCH